MQTNFLIKQWIPDEDGIEDTAIQPGEAASMTFETSIPVSKSASGKGTKRPYGK